MIKLETHFGKTSLELKGNVNEIYADTMVAIKSIYSAIKDATEAPGAVESFRKAFLQRVNDDDFWEQENSDDIVSSSEKKAVVRILHELGLM